MKIVKFFFYFFFLFLFCSCHTVIGNRLKKGSYYKLSFGEENANRGRFRLDGCYLNCKSENSDSLCDWGCVFYPDGICVDVSFNKNESINGKIDFANDLKIPKLYPKQWNFLMGVYEVRNDTIHCDMYMWKDILHFQTECWGVNFIVKDSCTLVCDMYNEGSLHFVPCENMLYPRAKFVKDRKWIWKTNEDWLKYKKSKKKKK